MMHVMPYTLTAAVVGEFPIVNLSMSEVSQVRLCVAQIQIQPVLLLIKPTLILFIVAQIMRLALLFVRMVILRQH